MLSFLNSCTIVKVCRTAREIVNLPDETYNRIEGIARSADARGRRRCGCLRGVCLHLYAVCKLIFQRGNFAY